MDVLVKFSVLMFTNYAILSFILLTSISGEKPHCVGDPLEPDKFSKEGDVGFVRDLCVDLIARNLFNTLKRSPSSLCLDLANTRTSTCFSKSLCIKWKRSSFWNIIGTKRVMSKAEAMLKDFNVVISESASLKFDEEKVIFECIDDVERKLVDSEAAPEDSQILNELRRLKNNFCTRYTLYHHQKKFQEKIGRNDAETMKRLESLIRNEDVGAAIKQFVHNFEDQNMVKITKFYINSDAPKTSNFLSTSISHLEFEFEQCGSVKFKTAVMKIPSLDQITDEKVKRNGYHREVLFYKRLLPQFYSYHYGDVNIFAPRIFAVTHENGIVLDDLADQGYVAGDPKTQLNWDQIQAALSILAEYHALGYKVLQDLDVEELKVASQPVQTAESLKLALSWFYKILEASGNRSLHEKILKVENEILNDDFGRNLDEERMTVIIHGDFRVDNILFKYDTHDRVSFTTIINWQSIWEASPVLDLINFFVTSVPIEMIKHLGHELRNAYLLTLNNILKSTESNRIYNQSEYEKDISDYKYYYLRALCIHWHHMTQSGLSNVEMETYKSKSIKWLKYLAKKGFI